jgi:hypothetical protein
MYKYQIRIIGLFKKISMPTHFIELPAKIEERKTSTMGLCMLAEAHWITKLYWHYLNSSQPQVLPAKFKQDDQVCLLGKGISVKAPVNYTRENGNLYVDKSCPSTLDVAFGANNYLAVSDDQDLHLHVLVNQFNGPWIKRRFDIENIMSSINEFRSYHRDTVWFANPEVMIELKLLEQLTSDSTFKDLSWAFIEFIQQSIYKVKYSSF